MPDRREPPAQCGEVRFAYRGFLAKARDQLLLAVLQVSQIVDVVLEIVDLGVQPPKLLFVVVVVFAHATRRPPTQRIACRSQS
jgi:hypothetical protein